MARFRVNTFGRYRPDGSTGKLNVLPALFAPRCRFDRSADDLTT
jgi:hypothetical protein